MSDDREETNERRRKARKTIAQGGREVADIFDITTGSIVTGYVFIVEMTNANGRYCEWLTGSGGEPDEEYTEGLDSWRVEGLVRKVIRDIYARNVVDE